MPVRIEISDSRNLGASQLLPLSVKSDPLDLTLTASPVAANLTAINRGALARIVADGEAVYIGADATTSSRLILAGTELHVALEPGQDIFVSNAAW